MRALIGYQYVLGVLLFLYGVSTNSFAELPYVIAGSVLVTLTGVEHLIYRLKK